MLTLIHILNIYNLTNNYDYLVNNKLIMQELIVWYSYSRNAKWSERNANDRFIEYQLKVLRKEKIIRWSINF